jgi:hypothetical protein
MRCSKCGHLGADARPNWIERSDWLPGARLRGFADTLSVAPLTYSVSRADVDLVVFCFAKAEDAATFCERFGGERLPGAQQ